VDPVSHVVMGRLVAGSIDRGGRAGTAAAAMIGALVPDIDLVLMPFGWDVYLRYHEVGTHSIAGAAVLGALVGALVRNFTARADGRRLALAASLAALSHVTLDVLSGARIAPAWPLVPTRVSVPLVAMGEPWLACFFVLAAAALWLVRPQRHHTARVILVLLSVVLGIRGVLYARVVSAVAADSRLDAPIARASQARWGTWRKWDVFERHQGGLRVWRVDAVSKAVVPVLDWPVTSESLLVGHSRSLSTVTNFLRVHELGFAIERPAMLDGTEVLWSDVRFCEQEFAGSPRIDCALWFGGVFDREGRPVTQVVHLPWWTHRRSPAP